MPNQYTKNNPTIEERFWSKVDKSPGQGPEGECWTWQASKDQHGYGEFWNGKRLIKAHRFACELIYGPLDSKIDACHTCDYPPCVRQSHVYPGTRQKNMDDMVDRGRSLRGIARIPVEKRQYGDNHWTHRMPEKRNYGDRNGSRTHPERHRRGEQTPNAKITEADVRDIRMRYAAGGITQKQLANERGLTDSLVCMIIKRKRWKHVE